MLFAREGAPYRVWRLTRCTSKGTLRLPRELPLHEGVAVRIAIHLAGRPGVIKHVCWPWTGTPEELERLVMDPEFLPEES
jgi:hypothetical protein